jgi:hypothetical protein
MVSNSYYNWIHFFIKSITLSLKRKTWWNWLISTTIILIITFAEVILYQIFFQGAWPTFIPHIIIGVSIILSGMQLIIQKLEERKVKQF